MREVFGLSTLPALDDVRDEEEEEESFRDDATHARLLSRRALLKTVGAVLEVERCFGYYLVPELRGHATGWTHVVAENPIAAGLCHKLLVVARRP